MSGAGNPPPVVVVGGGISGLAAAVGLTVRGIPTLLLEQKPTLGGRAYSFRDSTTGDVIDNGQHVLIAGYERTMAFLDTLGTRHLLYVQPRPSLLFHHPQKGFHLFRLPSLPSPFHLMWGVLTCGMFSTVDRWRILRAGVAIQQAKGEREEALKDLTIEQWLDSIGQSAECKRSFWEPLAISIMNEHIAQASARVFVRSLRTAFLTDWHSASLVIPRVGLSDLYVESAQRLITSRGGAVVCGADVATLLYTGSTIAGVQLKSGAEVECRAIIVSVPPNRAGALLPDGLMMDLPFSALKSIVPSPIVSIHLWFDTDFMEDDFVGLIGRTVQWVFNKRKINRENGTGGHVSAVISAAYEVVSFSNEELVDLALRDLRSAYPQLTIGPRHAVVIREKRATFPSTPETERLRPGQTTAVPNLFLAGDWTDTGYPATIEGAVLSAELCVQHVVDCISSGKF